jgi:hypothetical protein
MGFSFWSVSFLVPHCKLKMYQKICIEIMKIKKQNKNENLQKHVHSWRTF